MPAWKPEFWLPNVTVVERLWFSTATFVTASSYDLDSSSSCKRHPGVAKCPTYRNTVEVLRVVEGVILPTCLDFNSCAKQNILWLFLSRFDMPFSKISGSVDEVTIRSSPAFYKQQIRCLPCHFVYSLYHDIFNQSPFVEQLFVIPAC
jgi:hypothetical protein